MSAGRVRSIAERVAASGLLLDRSLYAYVARAPRTSARRIGYLLRRVRRRQALASMRAFLGPLERSERDWDALFDAHLVHVGTMVLELAQWPGQPLDDVLARIRLEGARHLQHALARGRGALVYFDHLGQLGCMSALARDAWPGANIVADRLPTTYWDRAFDATFDMGGSRRLRVGSDLWRRARECFARNEPVFVACDFAVSGTRDLWGRFGHAETHVSTGAARIALRSDVPVLYLRCVRRPDDGYALTLHPPLEITPSGDRREDARRLTQRALDLAAEGIRADPAQWWQWDWAPIRPVPSAGPRFSDVAS